MTARIGDALRAAPAAAPLADALTGDDGAWIVGGAIRDVLTNRPVVDLDLTVAGDEEALARRTGSGSSPRSWPSGWGRSTTR